MSATFLTTDQLAARIQYDPRTIRDQLIDSVLIEGTSASGYGKKKIRKDIYDNLTTLEKNKYQPILQTSDTNKDYVEWQQEYIPKEIYSNSIQKEFSKQKIVVGRLTKKIQACLDSNKFYVGKSTIIFDSLIDLRALLAIVNSRFADRWYFLKFETTHMAGGYIRYDIPYLEQLPIPDMTEDNQFNLISIVDRILDSGHLDRTSEQLILQVDDIVYKLFKLGYDEIKILDPDFTFSESEYNSIVI